MNNFIEFYVLMSIILLELMGVFIFGLLIQLFFRKCFGIDICQKIDIWLDKLDKYLTNLFWKGDE